LLLGIELVKGKSTREPFPRESATAEKIRMAALQKNVLTYPSQGCVDGLRGDHLLLAPPFIISSDECSQIAQALQFALAHVFPS
jgi:adenosylmethionine-8-amino-7-oxononanoate aminotransferase